MQDCAGSTTRPSGTMQTTSPDSMRATARLRGLAIMEPPTICTNRTGIILVRGSVSPGSQAKGTRRLYAAGFGVFYNVPVLLQQFVNVLSQYPVRNPQTFTATTTNPIQSRQRISRGQCTRFAHEHRNRSNLCDSLYLRVEPWSAADDLEDGLPGSDIPGVEGNEAPFGGQYQSGGSWARWSGNGKRSPSLQSSLRIWIGHAITFGNVTYLQTEGNSYYHSLQAKLQQNYSNGLSYLVSYTYGRSIDEGAGGTDSSSDSSKALPQNSYALKGERGLSDFDVRQRLSVSPVYDLPFGKKGKYLTSGWGSRLAGGWQLSSIIQWQTGRPFTVYYGTDNSQTGENSDRPNQVSNPNKNARTRCRSGSMLPHSRQLHWVLSAAKAVMRLRVRGTQMRTHP